MNCAKKTRTLAFFLTSTAVLASCAGRSGTSTSTGTPSTPAQVQAYVQATPPATLVSQQPSPVRPEAQLREYSNDEVVQVEDGVPVARSRRPTVHESTLQYWRHKYRGKVQLISTVKGDTDPHAPPRHQWRVPSEKLTVIFDSATGTVERVVRYVR